MIPNPPEDGDPRAWAAWIIICSFVGVVGYFFKRGGGSSDSSDPQISLPTRSGQPDNSISTRGMSPDVAAGFAALAVSQKQVMDENEQHEKRIQALEAERTGLVAHIVTLREGIKDGTIPPLPALAEAIKHLFPGD